jgi:hypothetical protein
VVCVSGEAVDGDSGGGLAGRQERRLAGWKVNGGESGRLIGGLACSFWRMNEFVAGGESVS